MIITHNSKANLHFIRHPQSEGNVLAGHRLEPGHALFTVADRNINVTDLGLQQAKEAGIAMTSIVTHPKVIIHSGYNRTITLAKAIQAAYKDKAIDVEMFEDHQIRERDQGYNSAVSQEDEEKFFGFNQDFLKRVGPYQYRPPGGESLCEVRGNRSIPFIERMFQIYKEGDIILVTHGRFMSATYFGLESISYDDCDRLIVPHGVPNCSLLSYEYTPDKNKHTVTRKFENIIPAEIRT